MCAAAHNIVRTRHAEIKYTDPMQAHVPCSPLLPSCSIAIADTRSTRHLLPALPFGLDNLGGLGTGADIGCFLCL